MITNLTYNTVSVSSRAYHLQFEELFNEQSEFENCRILFCFTKKIGFTIKQVELKM